jgi:uncharacterized protein YjbJ (UPF0337 family)
MTWARIKRNLQQLKAKTKGKSHELKNEVLAAINVRLHQLQGKIQQRGHANDQIRRDFDNWLP